MITKLKYTQCYLSKRATFDTVKYVNCLRSDTYQGLVEQSGTGKWSGWLFNWSSPTETKFRLGFGSRNAASSWVNQRLRAKGV